MVRIFVILLIALGARAWAGTEVQNQKLNLSATEIEQQIRQLEFQIDGGLSDHAPDPVTYANLKEQLNQLYAQRDFRTEQNPLDQGTETCPGAPLSGMPIIVAGTTVGYADNHSPYSPCGNTFAPDVVYSFVAPHTMSYTITTEGSSYDTYLYIIGGGPCPGATQVGCDDDGGSGTTSSITVTLIGGTSYYIYVDGYNSNSGYYVLTIRDNCEVFCQPGDVIECAETRAAGHEINDCNGGCNLPVPVTQEVLPFQTVCGRTFTYLDGLGESQRDVDVYRISIAEACSLRFSLTSEVRLYLFILTDNCPWSILWQAPLLQYPCSTTTYLSPVLEPGTYQIWIAPPVFDGINDYREYRLQTSLVPASGCTINGVITGPGGYAGDICWVEPVECSGVQARKNTFAVVVPSTSLWSFSLCGNDSWDSFMGMSTGCCGGYFVTNDDGCGEHLGLSTLGCVLLTRGIYYVDVTDGFYQSCAPFTLNVAECTGSCCYGDPTAPSCQTTTYSGCEALNGHFTVGEPCSTNACAPRPGCMSNSIFGQYPWLPDEQGADYASHEDFATRCDNYSVSGLIGSIRYWGFSRFCDAVPEDFVITFTDSVTTQTYNVTTVGAVLPPVYYYVMNMHEYTVELYPPCSITSGTVSVVKVNDPTCIFAWATSEFGDNYGPCNGVDYAFCLGEGVICDPVDSLTIKWESPGTYRLDWWQPQWAAATLYYTTNPNGVYPADYSAGFTHYYDAGHQSVLVATQQEYMNLIVVEDCTPGVLAAPVSEPLIRRIE